jgi:hypothetical protein
MEKYFFSEKTIEIHRAEPLLRSRQPLSYSRISQYFMEAGCVAPSPQESSTFPHPEPDECSVWVRNLVFDIKGGT